jgi:putative Mg2+ transporter-C (MgtC) family protein
VAALEWYEVVGRLLLATLLGAAVGLEREFDGHDAGLRTHLLVTLGAALFAVMSVAGFDAVVGDPSRTNVTIDVTRIVSYIAPGVGFIGGGAILKSGGKVTGITTAASLWVAAAIGAASGVGFWEGAVTTTVIALFALEVLQPLSKWAAELGRRHGRLPN